MNYKLGAQWNNDLERNSKLEKKRKRMREIDRERERYRRETLHILFENLVCYIKTAITDGFLGKLTYFKYRVVSLIIFITILHL